MQPGLTPAASGANRPPGRHTAPAAHLVRRPEVALVAGAEEDAPDYGPRLPRVRANVACTTRDVRSPRWRVDGSRAVPLAVRRSGVAEEAFAAGDRCLVRWLYRYTSADGQKGHIRGVDLFRVRDGKVAEKLSYVKG